MTFIDKHKTSSNAIQNIVNNDFYCWTYKRCTKIQIGERVILSHLYVMKAWSENLFTWVPNEDKDRLNRALHVLIFYPSENYFDRNLKQSYVEFQHIPIFATYINFRWAGINMPWREL